MGSGNDPGSSTKVKRNVYFKDCSSDGNQYSKNDKRSKMIASDGRSMVLNNRPTCGPMSNKSPSANIIVINGAWVQGAPAKQNVNTAYYGGVNEVALHTNNLENNGSWIFQDQNSEGDINLGLEIAKSDTNCQNRGSVETNVNYCDDSLTSLNDYSPVPFRNFETRSEDDRDTKSLSWLFNFNVHSLVNPGGMKTHHTPQQDLEASTSMQDTVEMRASPTTPSSLTTYQGADQVGLCSSDSKSNTRKFHQGQPALKPTSHGIVKPPFTYSELIEKALTESVELTVSELYHWISFHFPYYQANDDRWKNSVRHNLSINPHFRKGRKSSQGAGHLWSLAPSYVKKADTDSETKLKKQNSQYATDIHVVSLQEVEAATASIEEDKENRQLPPNDLYYFDSGCYSELGEKVDDEEFSITILGPGDDRGLVQTAEEILNGVKKDVEVQYMHESNIQVVNRNGSDFLNPVSMQEVVEECGLGYHLGATGIGADGTSFMITDINPETLGINIVETITPDLFSDNETIDIS